VAVYTQLDREQIEVFLEHFDLAALKRFQGASDGVENSTFFLELTDNSQWVLTLFETLSHEELPFYIELLTFLYQRDLAVPCPQEGSSQSGNSKALHTLSDKPALLFPRAQGKHLNEPNPAACAKVAVQLARMHQVSKDFPGAHHNPRGVSWFEETFAFIQNAIGDKDKQLIQQQIDLLKSLQEKALGDLPSGIIHGDLFRDNVLFDGEEISALIDFYNAGNGPFLLDIAITFNDWCIDDSANLLEANAEAFMQSYQAIRPFSAEESAHWVDMLKIAACRFWLSRLKAVELHRQGQEQSLKDPNHYKKVLLLHK